jgi:type I restriction enzyme, S subunit
MRKRYDSYKDSGVEWIGEIPSGWGIKKFKHFIKEIGDGGTPSRSEEDNFGGEINWIVVSDIKERITSTKETLSQKGFNSSSTKLWDVGDVIISLGGTIGKVGILGIPSTTKQGICGMKPNQTTTNKYVFYLLQLNSQLFNDWSVGSTIFEFRPTRLRELHFQIPPLSEQQQIVSFLDTKTSLIDSLIEKTQRKIELLKEKRTSLINEVVTKGLNPNVEMKDSGVEWIGEIPVHWLISKFKYVSKIVTGNTPSKTNEELYYTDSEDGFLWVKPTSLNKGLDYVNESVERLTEEGKKQTRLIPKDSTMICCIGNTIGKHSISGQELSTNQQINSVVPNQKKLNHWFCLFYVNVFTKDLLKWSNFVTLPIFTKSDLEDTSFILPPVEEQNEIVKKIRIENEIIDTTITKEQKRIELLEEYRQSLISEVVTGKIKVTTDE